MARRSTAVVEQPATRRRRSPAPKPAAPPEIDDLDEELEDLDEPEEIEEEAPPPKRRPGRPRKVVAEPEPVEDEEIDEDELEDLDDLDDEVEEKPAKKVAAPKRKKIEYSTAWLADLINEKLDKSVTPYQLRDFIRKLARKGQLQRDIGVDRSRYEWTGPKDPEVLFIFKQVKAGALDREKKGNLENLRKAREKRAANLKAQREAEAAEDDVDEIEETPPPRRRRTTARKAKPAPEPELEEMEDEDEDEELEDLDD